MASGNVEKANKGATSKQLVALVVAIVLVVAWCAFIFYMSSRPSDESGAMSGDFSFRLLSLVWPDFKAMSSENQQFWCDVIDYPVRKAAHFSEFTLLGILTANLLTRIKRYACREPHALLAVRGYVAAWALGTLYAATDELHQIFVPGRACLPTDVLIDSSGVLFGVIICAFVFHLMRYNDQAKTRQQTQQ